MAQIFSQLVVIADCTNNNAYRGTLASAVRCFKATKDPAVLYTGKASKATLHNLTSSLASQIQDLKQAIDAFQHDVRKFSKTHTRIVQFVDEVWLISYKISFEKDALNLSHEERQRFMNEDVQNLEDMLDDWKIWIDFSDFRTKVYYIDEHVMEKQDEWLEWTVHLEGILKQLGMTFP